MDANELIFILGVFAFATLVIVGGSNAILSNYKEMDVINEFCQNNIYGGEGIYYCVSNNVGIPFICNDSNCYWVNS
jgi:hypothetical protein